MVNIFPVRQPGRKRVKITQPPCQPVDFLQHFCCGWTLIWLDKDSDDLEVGRESPEPKLGFFWVLSGPGWLVGFRLGYILYLGCSWNFQFVGVTWLVLRSDSFCLITDLCFQSLYTQYVLCMYSIYIYFMFGSSVSIEGWEVLHTWKGR